MKKLITFMAVILTTACFGNLSHLENYKEFLENGTYDHQDWSFFPKRPQSRYYTFKRAFEEFLAIKGKTVIELGTSRSFVDGAYVGCNDDNIKYWEPNNPKKWDWGAGMFTYMAATCLTPYGVTIHTVDLISSHITRCKIMTKPFASHIRYHVNDSVKFLRRLKRHSIDLLYLDTGDIHPIEPTAALQLQEAKIIVAKHLIKPGGLILIDDVRHPVPIRLDNDKTGLGKAKYSIPYFLKNGFEIVEDEFQVLLRKK